MKKKPSGNNTTVNQTMSNRTQVENLNSSPEKESTSSSSKKTKDKSKIAGSDTENEADKDSDSEAEESNKTQIRRSSPRVPRTQPKLDESVKPTTSKAKITPKIVITKLSEEREKEKQKSKSKSPSKSSKLSKDSKGIKLKEFSIVLNKLDKDLEKSISSRTRTRSSLNNTANDNGKNAYEIKIF